MKSWVKTPMNACPGIIRAMKMLFALTLLVALSVIANRGSMGLVKTASGSEFIYRAFSYFIY